MKFFSNIFCFSSKENKLKSSTSNLINSENSEENKKNYFNRNVVANNEALKNKEYALKIYNTYGPRVAHHIIKSGKSKSNKEPHTLKNNILIF